MYTLTTATGADAPPSDVQGAVSWMREKYAAFLALGPELVQLRHTAATAAAQAKAAGDADRQAAARALVSTLSDQYERWNTTAGRARWVAQQVPGFLGAWVVPVAVSTVALAVVAYMAYLFAKMGLLRAAVQAVIDGDLTPDEARQLGVDLKVNSPGVSFGTFSTGTLVGAAALFWFLSSRNGGRRAVAQ